MLRVVGAIVSIVALVIVAYVASVWVGLRLSAQMDGVIGGVAVRRPVTILRDWRGVPDIRADNAHDLFFADGYVQGAGRLFQLDLMRRYAYGTLSEVFGKPALATDEVQRTVSVAKIVSVNTVRFLAANVPCRKPSPMA